MGANEEGPGLSGDPDRLLYAWHFRGFQDACAGGCDEEDAVRFQEEIPRAGSGIERGELTPLGNEEADGSVVGVVHAGIHGEDETMTPGGDELLDVGEGLQRLAGGVAQKELEPLLADVHPADGDLLSSAAGFLEFDGVGADELQGEQEGGGSETHPVSSGTRTCGSIPRKEVLLLFPF